VYTLVSTAFTFYYNRAGMKNLFSLVLCGLILLLSSQAKAQWLFDLEGGAAWTGPYNTVQIPGNTGTRFDLAKDFEQEGTPYFRLRMGYTIGRRHTISVLYAPLTITGRGAVDRPLLFQDTQFAANTSLRSVYRFNSYRLTYRYDFIRQERLLIGAGITGKIRDAEIRLESQAETAVKTDFGFVPLINFYIAWEMVPKLSLLIEGDALVGPGGRAEDIFAGLAYGISRDRFLIKAGYRVLEGGANNDTVYNFSWINYAAAGFVVRF
jgi:hypothetical protein